MAGLPVTELQAMRRDCAEKRFAYQHARSIYGEALRLLLPTDLSALRDELSQALLDYYSAHGALHGAIKRAAPVRLPSRTSLH